jgi:hypothetical protein
MSSQFSSDSEDFCELTATAMRAEGLEPPRAEAHQDLNLARIPIPPRPLGSRKA